MHLPTVILIYFSVKYIFYLLTSFSQISSHGVAHELQCIQKDNLEKIIKTAAHRRRAQKNMPK